MPALILARETRYKMRFPGLLFLCTLLFQYYSLQTLLKIPNDNWGIQLLLGVNMGVVSGVISAVFITWGFKNIKNNKNGR